MKKMVVCSTCGYSPSVKVDLTLFTCFVCPKCNGQHKIEQGNLGFVKKREQQIDDSEVFTLELFESYQFKNKYYNLYSIAKKKSVVYKWIELGGVSNSSDFHFFSIEKDNGNNVSSLTPFELPKSFNINNAISKGIRKNKKSFSYDERFKGNVEYAIGFFAYDIDQSVEYLNFYEEDIESDNYLSVEKAENQWSIFWGQFISLTKFLYSFSNKKEVFRERYQIYTKTFYKLFFASLALFLALFLIFHVKTWYGKDETRHISDVLYDVGQFEESETLIFEYPVSILYSKNEILNIDGSISSNVISNLQKIQLMNVNTHKVVFAQMQRLFYNSQNDAMALDIKLMDVPKGDYVLKFELNKQNGFYRVDEPANGTRTMLDIDLRFRTGHKIVFWPIIVALGLVVIIFYFAFNYLQSSFSFTDVSWKAIARIKNYQFALFLGMALVAYVSLESYNTLFRKVNFETLEDTSYTGRRSHYVYRNYSSGGHK